MFPSLRINSCSKTFDMHKKAWLLNSVFSCEQKNLNSKVDERRMQSCRIDMDIYFREREGTILTDSVA